MLKKLSPEKLDEILEAGIELFAEKGLHGAGMASIARQAGVSVGVLYKYYANKEDFFQACLRHSLESLEGLLEELTSREDKLLNYSRRLIRALQDFSALHPSHIRLYHQITSSSGETARQLAEEIEGLSSRLYTRLISRGRETGTLRRDMDPGLFAFFFDNLLMMLQFSYCCDYYRARMELYCGGLPEDSAVEEQLLRFLESAFTFERSLVPHGDSRGENR
ncbi:MAG TPA: TetR/AcrR family transcriptional regulator [Candidatus Limivicinus faecipullorum]|nr:TetR/AcrR family transcriptional regulator [Candidatus Limivicinus faecipullorum]